MEVHSQIKKREERKDKQGKNETTTSGRGRANDREVSARDETSADRVGQCGEGAVKISQAGADGKRGNKGNDGAH